jgi:NTP pyrophosphatase (non-canonical NTP hydrolase)
MNDEFKVIANITVPVDDVTEQAFREGYAQGKSEDSRIIQIANHYGYTAQSDIIIEECAELTQAILKLRRAWSDSRLENVKEELADVLIMARQLRVMLGAEDIDRIIGEKLDRQIERIADETAVSGK